MAKSKSFNAAEDLLFGTSTNKIEKTEAAEKKTEKEIDAKVSDTKPVEEGPVSNSENDVHEPVGDKLILVHKEPKSVRKNWLITPSNDRDLRAEAKSHGISVNELINLIFEQRYGRIR